MNIGYIYEFNAYPPQGGKATHVYQLVQWFTKRGHTVHTIGDSQTPGIARYPFDDIGIDRFLNSIDLLYIRIDGWYLSRSPIQLQCMNRATVPVVWEINAPSNENLAFLEHNLDGHANTAAVRIAKRLMRKAHRLRVLSRIRREENIRRRYAQKVAAAVCVSDALGRYSQESLEIKKTYVLPNGSDPQLFSPLREPIDFGNHCNDQFQVLYAGSPLYPWQGLGIIKKVAERIAQITDKISFLLLVNESTTELPRATNVIVCEKVSYFDVARYILAADVCLCLYEDFTWSKWGFHLSPIKLFDYMACARPVIASAIGQIRSVIDDGKDGLLTSNDPSAVVEKLLCIYERRANLEEMGKLAREKVIRHYNWERVADKTLEIFKSLQPR